MMARVEETLKKANIAHTGLLFDGNSVKVRLADPTPRSRPVTRSARPLCRTRTIRSTWWR